MAGVITRVLGRQEELAGSFDQVDPLLLTSEERASPHMVMHTEGGRKVRVSLPRGTEVFDGDVLAVEDRVAIVVHAAAEDLFVVRPDTAERWGVAGFQLGNLHRPVRFVEGAMLTPADPMVSDVLSRLDIPFSRETAPFVGRRYGAVTEHSHHHHHHH